MLMNFLIYVIGLTGFWIAGFALMYGAMPVGSLGGTAGLDAAKEFVITLGGKPFGLFATNGWFLGGNVYDVGVYTIFLFQMVFMDTAATIPTGSMAERWNLKTFSSMGSSCLSFSTRYLATGLGVAVGYLSLVSTLVWGTGTLILLDRVWCTPLGIMRDRRSDGSRSTNW